MTSPESALWLPGLVIAPLAGAVGAFLVPRLAVQFGLLTGVGVSACAATLVVRVLQNGPSSYAVGGWGAPLGVELAVDGLSAFMVALTAVSGAAVSVYAVGYFAPAPAAHDTTHERRYFWPLWLLLWAGLNALFLSGDVFNLYVTLELLGFSAVALVSLAASRGALTAALRYLLAGSLGSLCFLLGVALLYGTYATVDLASLATLVRSDAPTRLALTLMTGGLLIKGALVPLHFWLPPAHSNAPAPVSALLSALVVKAPCYILLRLWFDSFAAVRTAQVSLLFGLLGVGAVLWGAVHALRQSRLKLVIAYSTVAQLGYLYLLFPLAHDASVGFTAWSGGLLFMSAHACAKTAMFLAAGNIAYALGHDDIARLGGVARALPRSVGALALAGVSLVGLPPSGGFVGKWLLLSASVHQGQWWCVTAVVAGTALAIGYVGRVISGTLAESPVVLPAVRVPAVMEWTTLVLAVLAAVMGLIAFAPLELLRAGAPVAGPVLMGGPR